MAMARRLGRRGAVNPAAFWPSAGVSSSVATQQLPPAPMGTRPCMTHPAAGRARAAIMEATVTSSVLGVKMRLITPDCPLFTARADDSPFEDDPFWAFVWAGSFGLTRYIFANPGCFGPGSRVLDLAAGCGIASIAATFQGATAVANEIDPLACAAVELNAELNGTALSGSISTILTGLSRIFVGIHSRRALPSPVCA